MRIGAASELLKSDIAHYVHLCPKNNHAMLIRSGGFSYMLYSQPYKGDAANRTALVLSVLSIAPLPICSVEAALVRAVVEPIKFNCSAFGDPFCAGGQVLGDPALERSIQTVTTPHPGSLAVADKMYTDPRFGTNNSTSGSAFAGFGILKAQSAATVSSQPPLSTGSASLMRLQTISTAIFEDTVTIMPGSSPSLIGTIGTMSANLKISGLLNTTGVHGKPGTSFNPTMANANWKIQITVGGTTFGSVLSPAPGFFGGESVDSAGNESFFGLGPAATIPLSAAFVFGVPTTLSVAFSTDASAVVDAANVLPLTSGFTFASAESLYLSTAAWNGIQSVKSGATPVAFTVNSASGVNYIAPVPEPSAALLLLSGLLVLIWKSRARPE